MLSQKELEGEGGTGEKEERLSKLNQPLPKHDCLIVSKPEATTECAQAATPVFPITTPPPPPRVRVIIQRDRWETDP